MDRFATIRFRDVLRVLAGTVIAAAWSGCAAGTAETTGTGGSTTSSSSSGGTGGTGGSGGIGASSNGSGGSEICTSTSAEAKPVALDLIFLVDRSQSMNGPKWVGTKAALTEFFNDPKSIGVSVGLNYVPVGDGCECDAVSYQVLEVPVDKLPGNTFALTNSMPAKATGACTPNYGGLEGSLQAATAYQDAHPTHKVNLVFATDGEAWTQYGCDPVTIEQVAALAKGALNYNGVHTYVIGVDGSINQNLNKIAAAGGTTAAYNVTVDVSEFAATIAEIRNAALGCEFEIPEPPDGEELVPDLVNFTYMPQGAGTPVTLPRADNLVDCAGSPGWYYDNNFSPTKIILCPASCSTVQNDTAAKVAAAFGCQSVAN